MTGGGFLVLVKMDILPEIETEWNNWFDTQYIPSRLNIPGFVYARRFIAIEGEPKYWALYDLAGADVLTSEVYLKLREKEASLPPDSFEAINPKLPNIFHGIYEQIYPERGEYKIPNTGIIFAVGHDVPLNREEEFNAWYDTEHIPFLNRVPGIVTARRLKVIEKGGRFSSSPKYVALYDIESEKVFQSEAFIKVQNSPWSSWVRSWYIRRFYIIARRIYPK